MRKGYGGTKEWVVPSLIGISPSIQQQLHYLDVVILRREKEWGNTIGIYVAGVYTIFQHFDDASSSAAIRCIEQSRPKILLRWQKVPQ